jgi:hypothetical protein
MNVVANNMATGEGLEWVMVGNGDITATGAGVECIMAAVAVAAVAVTTEAVCITDLTLGCLDTGASSVRKRSLPNLRNI